MDVSVRGTPVWGAGAAWIEEAACLLEGAEWASA
jgi:hypothetical protein